MSAPLTHKGIESFTRPKLYQIEGYPIGSFDEGPPFCLNGDPEWCQAATYTIARGVARRMERAGHQSITIYRVVNVREMVDGFDRWFTYDTVEAR